MKIYIMADIEGISGVFLQEQVMSSGERYNEARNLMTREVNICAEALKDSGVDTVYFHDCHCTGNNAVWDKLSPAIDYVISGNEHKDRFCEQVKECDGVILLGYHAMAGTRGGILEHTIMSEQWQNCYINGVKSGEARIDAAILGDLDIPVIMGSGDDVLEKEVKEFLPDVVTAVVKEGIGCNTALLLSPARAENEIREKTRKAIENIANAKPFKISAPVKFTIELVERGQMPNVHSKPYMEIEADRKYSVTGDSVVDAFYKTLII